jgi:ABC-type uncharacterized transport system substrate-binding protein
MHELVPAATNVALLVNPASRNAAALSTGLDAAAKSLELRLLVVHAGTERELDAAFADIARLPAGGLIISTDAFFISQMERLAVLTVRHAVPAVYSYREFAAAGGLASYGGNLADGYRQIGDYAARILKGETPAALPGAPRAGVPAQHVRPAACVSRILWSVLDNGRRPISLAAPSAMRTNSRFACPRMPASGARIARTI